MYNSLLAVQSFDSRLAGREPTVVEPSKYRDCSLKALERYMLPVPDRWDDLYVLPADQTTAR